MGLSATSTTLRRGAPAAASRVRSSPSSAPLAPAPTTRTLPPYIRFSGLDALVALVDCLAASYVSTTDGATAAVAGDCTVCLSPIAEGERVRTLACRHALPATCLDGWFDQSCLSCLLCRAGYAARDDDAGRHAGEDAVWWFAHF